MSGIAERQIIIRYSTQDILHLLMEDGAQIAAPSELRVRVESSRGPPIEASRVEYIEFTLVEDAATAEALRKLHGRARKVMRRLRRRLSTEDFRLVLSLEELLNEVCSRERR